MEPTLATDEELQQIYAKFLPLYEDLQVKQTFSQKQPLLAHYTSIDTLERIASTDEIWLSNPLFMDDLEELRFGILEGSQQVLNSAVVKDGCGSSNRAEIFIRAFNHYVAEFSNKHALDLYVFCMSEHERNNSDGLLSMWRGYGGNGKGVAMVIDTAKINPTHASPIVLAQVEYATGQERVEWLAKKIGQFSALLKSLNIPDERLYMAAYAIFERIKVFSIFTKHHGFHEEREWRLVYLKERDLGKKLDSMLSYAVGRRGIEPKLKFKVMPISGITSDDLSLTKIVHQIILGPSVSSPLAKSALLRMLERNGKSELKDRIVASTIPFRVGGVV